MLYKIFKKSHKINDGKIIGAKAKYLSFFRSKNAIANMNENINIHDKFTSPVNAEIAEISFTSPPPKEYGFLK